MTHSDQPTTPDDFLAALADPPFAAAQLPTEPPPERPPLDAARPVDLVDEHQPAVSAQPVIDLAVDPDGDRQDFEDMLAFIRAHADPATVVVHLTPADFMIGLVDLPDTPGGRR